MYLSWKKIIAIIVLAVSILFYLQSSNRIREKELVQLYNEKNNNMLIYLIQDINPHKHLADALETLSKADPNDPNRMKAAIHNAQQMSYTWQDRLMFLTNLCDKSGSELKPEYSINYFNNSTKLQQDTVLAIFSADIRNVLRTISYRYKDNGAGGFTTKERDVLRELIRELRTLENKYYPVRDFSKWPNVVPNDQRYMDALKEDFLNSLQPSLKRIDSLCNDYQK